MNTKVSIITHYYKSKNYGGILQSYALCRVINELGYNAEQISYNMFPTKKAGAFSLLYRTMISALGKLDVRKWSYRKKNKRAQDLLKARFESMNSFGEKYIPHTEKVYDEENVDECGANYDAFITGSDQVWNLQWYYPAFFLSFVPSGKRKLSYAASMAMSKPSNEQKALLRENLKDFNAISVREKDSVELLKDIVPAVAEWVLDPTMLLDSKKWDDISSEKEFVKEPYVFCYFLGDDLLQRELAAEFAQHRGLKLVTLPYLNCMYRECDDGFGDIRLYDVGPQDFISLIKHAEYIFTDSFHATVFSGIYKKQYFVFPRNREASMSSRIYSLIELYEAQERFCDTDEKATIKYIDALQKIDYSKPLEKLAKMRCKSMLYLERNLKYGEGNE